MAFGQSLKNFALGTNPQIEQVQRYNPQQLGSQNFLLNQGQQNIQKPYAGFDPIAQRATSQFNQQTIPSLAERFSSTGGALSSPAFASQLGSAGAGLSEGLAALQSQYGMQNQSQGLNMLNAGMQPNYENFMIPGQQGLLQHILPMLGSAGTLSGLAGLAGGGGGIMQILQLLAGLSGGNMGGGNMGGGR